MPRHRPGLEQQDKLDGEKVHGRCQTIATGDLELLIEISNNTAGGGATFAAVCWQLFVIVQTAAFGMSLSNGAISDST